MTGKTHDASDDTFKTLVGVKEPVLVDFHAEYVLLFPWLLKPIGVLRRALMDLSLSLVQTSSWCGPCRLIDPVLREAVSGSGEVTLVRVNVDECPEVSSKFQVHVALRLSNLVCYVCMLDLTSPFDTIYSCI